MDQHWDDWADDGDYHGDAAETANLGDPDEPLASAGGGYGDGFQPDGGDYGADPGGDPGGDPAPAGDQPGGFLEDDPMGAFDTDGLGDAGEPDHFGDPDASSDSPDGSDGPDGFDGPDGVPGDGPGAEGGADVGPDAFDHDTDGDASADPESVVGADPDVDPDADWSPADFPAQLDFAAPEPVDGYPWTDPSAVAAPGTGGDDPAAAPDGAPPAQDLLDYAGADGGADPWAALVGSDDPAASSLGRWWAPGT